jgi:mRNA interferase MazF
LVEASEESLKKKPGIIPATMSSMNSSRNDVVRLPIPFSDLTSRKVRPAVIIGRNGLDLFFVPVSSQFPNTDFLLKEWRAAALNVPCGMKAQIATVEQNPVVKVIGTLAGADQTTSNEKLELRRQLAS